MRLQELEEAKKIWEKDKYVDINNFHYDCSVCEDKYDQNDHTYVDEDGNESKFDCPVCGDNDDGKHTSETEDGNKQDNHSDLIYRIYPIQTWNPTGCKTCEIIDYLCNLYYRDNETNTKERNEQLIEEILSYEINAYKLLKLRESFGFTYQRLDGEIVNGDYIEGVYDISHYLYSSGYSKDELDTLRAIDRDINDTRIDQAKWCGVCGARKPNVILDNN